MVRPQVGWKYQHNADKSLIIEIVEIAGAADWIAKAKWPSGHIETLNTAALGHYWHRLM